MSEIRANTVSDAAGTGPATLTGQYAAKAWVNFNGTGTIAIRQSGNVSSLTDNNTGDYTVNFTTAMADSSFAVAGAAQELSADYAVVFVDRNDLETTTSVRVQNLNMYSNVSADNPRVSVSIFR